ncbi:hypothetical protein KQ735_15345, partial [Listeria monocytogenes]|nr:hypothetical protein [Listeria monocytogenes]
ALAQHLGDKALPHVPLFAAQFFSLISLDELTQRRLSDLVGCTLSAWRLLEREADWLPPWRELLRVYHRLEARGEMRGGRCIAGRAGEQFALAEAVGLLREVRKRPPDGAM